MKRHADTDQQHDGLVDCSDVVTLTAAQAEVASRIPLRATSPAHTASAASAQRSVPVARQEDRMTRTFDIPETIALSKVRAFLADLGIDATYLRELRIGMDGVYVEVVATDENGKIIATPDGNIAEHRIAMRLDGDA